ncbi:hypothetical protein GCM10010307_27300 [Streptomyces vastus]|uniref:Uncharacterized protein n=1 Tax=Streptomyces vastus TaxID=285451 RepID=A0ABN3QS20_9ACTN
MRAADSRADCRRRIPSCAKGATSASRIVGATSGADSVTATLSVLPLSRGELLGHPSGRQGMHAGGTPPVRTNDEDPEGQRRDEDPCVTELLPFHRKSPTATA